MGPDAVGATDILGDYLSGLLSRVGSLSPISSATAAEPSGASPLPPLPPGFKVDVIPQLPAGYRLSGQLGNLAYKAASPPLGDVIDQSTPAIDPVTAGGIIGGGIGTVAGALPTAGLGAPMGGLIGTTLGASIGKSGEQLYKGLTGEKQYESPRQVLGEYPSAIAEQTAMQILGQGIGSGITKAIGTVAPIAREGVARAQEMLLPRGGTLSLGQMGHSSVMEPLESFARSGVGGKGIFIGLDKRNADALQAIKDELVTKISSAPVDDQVAGNLFKDAISRGEAAHQVASAALYKDFDSRVSGVLVDAAPVRDFAQTLADTFDRIGNVGKSDAGGRLIDQLASVPNTMTFSDAQTLRSSLLATVRDLERTGTETKALGFAKKAVSLTDEAMNASAQGLPDDLVAQYRNINKFYRTGKEAFNDEIIRGLVTTQPERVGETLFRTGNVSEIDQIKKSLDFAAKMDKAVDAKDVYSRLQAGYLNGLLTARAATNVEGETTAMNLMKTLADAKTRRQFVAMFDADQRQAIQDFGRTAYLTLRNKPSGFGVLTSMFQAGALADIVSGSQVTGSPYKDLGILGSPAVLALMFANPRALGIATRVLKSGVEIGTPAFTKWAAELSGALKETQ